MNHYLRKQYYKINTPFNSKLQSGEGTSLIKEIPPSYSNCGDVQKSSSQQLEGHWFGGGGIVFFSAIV